MTVAHHVGRRPARGSHGGVAHGQRPGIGEHVRGVGDQCERTRNPAADRFRDHESGRDPQRPQQRGLAGTLAMAVPGVRIVVVSMSMTMTMVMLMLMVIVVIVWAHCAAYRHCAAPPAADCRLRTL